MTSGIFAFASTTFILSMFNVNTRGVHTPNVVVGMAIFAGGLLQFIAGMWQFPRRDVFGATVFSSYGTFWMSYSTIMIPGTGILASYSDPREFANAMGIFLITWFAVTVMFILPTIRRNLSFTILLSVLSIAFLCLAVGEFTGKNSLTKGGGVAGIITAIIAYYVAVSETLAAERSPILKLPQGVWV
ncbi:hypothetical protein GALMADRAFT_55322 [Galerina marginata CBS 339.88]|uniref:Uncharacterized protein n=1 Tax=Galerina marginata (strain CBS 339.88) TaxID=685588 RepID=A0A067TMR6_GALM3|nr:hypothetical protein GALMADRAFT_55322 [Galerina marginata CBS 339.88]